MSESVNDIWIDDGSVDGNIPAGFLSVQQILDAFVDVAYDAAYPKLSFGNRRIHINLIFGNIKIKRIIK